MPVITNGGGPRYDLASGTSPVHSEQVVGARPPGVMGQGMGQRKLYAGVLVLRVKLRHRSVLDERRQPHASGTARCVAAPP
ncbi:hypothetical protein PHYPSEUDO_010723, partial [Phytophthora pseudosyringae]